MPVGWTHVYHCRDVEDPGIVISFGLFDGTLDELRDAQARLGRKAQVDRIGPHVEKVLLDGSYEIIEELSPVAARARRALQAEGSSPVGAVPPPAHTD